MYTSGCRPGDDGPRPTCLIEDAISPLDRGCFGYSVTGNGAERGGRMLVRAQVLIGAGITQYRRYKLSESFAIEAELRTLHRSEYQAVRSSA